ncbi:MAG: CHAT domain-containing protein [Candidatus Helarchaeota archaeon]
MVNRTKSKHAFNRKRNSVFAPDFKHLPNVKKEAKDILNYFDNAKIYMDNEAITGNLYKELKKTRGFIHIATHASRSCENPLFSQILMNDGPFFPFNLFDVNINADLVTLSGCQTAAPGLYYGESFSLAAAFGLAGSKHILATLWSVSDVVSKIFMNEFYNMLAKKQDIFIAYKNAADKVYEITENPAHWGAFVLISA